MVLNIKKGWSVIEDIHDTGERFEIFKESFDPTLFGTPDMKAMPPWQPVDRLEHLQLTLAENPYYGFGLRQFNYSPWWYRNEFTVDKDFQYACLQFKGVDYFADVWLNETYLGSHEGYNTPFSFDVGSILKQGKNLLIVKVRAPLDFQIVEGHDNERFLFLYRDQMKGTYEHSDSFLPRDVNPLGIWDDVTVEFYQGIRNEYTPHIDALPENDFNSAAVTGKYSLHSEIDCDVVQGVFEIRECGNPDIIVTEKQILTIKKGANLINIDMVITNPKLWNIWERGYPHRYEITCILRKSEVLLFHDVQAFGVRKIEVVRNEKEVYFILNNERVYLRGTTYFPDVYISSMERQRYIRDIQNAKTAGMNILRIHVHSEKNEFYDLCDQMGMLLVQDSDFNWTHPTSEEWSNRALKMYKEMLHRLGNHPSIICWVCMNESRLETYTTKYPGPQMVEMTQKMDPNRPFIMDSWAANHPLSGDSHNYEGSLHGAHTHYTNIFGSYEKLNTEFGMDAPPVYETLRHDPDIRKLLVKVLDGTDTIQYYQYRYIKFFIEHYRMQKFNPCGGHFQFLFTDTAPCSLFGVYDRYGVPKYAIRALNESNQPVGIMMETDGKKAVAIWAVNDLLNNFGTVRITWQITDETNALIVRNEKTIELQKNSLLKVTDLDFTPESGHDYTVLLKIFGDHGEIITENCYERAFHHPEHVPGHPYQMHHGLALRMYWEWLGK